MADYGEYDSTLYKNQSDNGSQIRAGLDYMKNRYGANAMVSGSTYPYTQPPSPVSKRVTKTTKTYDEEGRVVSEETTEEITYGQLGIVYPQWWQNPVISSSDTAGSIHDSKGYPPTIN